VLIRLERISGLLAKLAAYFCAIALIEWSDLNFWAEKHRIFYPSINK